MKSRVSTTPVSAKWCTQNGNPSDYFGVLLELTGWLAFSLVRQISIEN